MLPNFYFFFCKQKKCLSMDYFSFSILKFHWITTPMEKNGSDWVGEKIWTRYFLDWDGVLSASWMLGFSIIFPSIFDDFSKFRGCCIFGGLSTLKNHQKWLKFGRKKWGTFGTRLFFIFCQMFTIFGKKWRKALFNWPYKPISPFMVLIRDTGYPFRH